MGKKPKTNEDVDKELKEKFGNEFIRIGNYVNASTYIEFKHTTCENNYCRSNNLTLLRISYLNFKNITTILNTIFESSTTRETINSINDIMYISKEFEVINGIYKGVSYSSS